MANVQQICALLESVYERPECDPEYGPLDELILTILSQTTSAINYNRAFANLKQKFASWEDLRLADIGEVEDAIRVGGLAKIKSQRIRRVLDDLHTRRGELSLNFLADMPDEDARAFLMSFDGVGIKTASCVLMFSLRRPVFPVDTHVHRISQHLALIDSSVNAEAAHGILQAIIDDKDVYSLHVNLVTHGRRVCKARNPACDDCVLLSVCPWGQKFLASEGI